MSKKKYTREFNAIQNKLDLLLQHFEIKPIKLKENRQYLVSYGNMEICRGNGIEIEKYLKTIGSEMTEKVTINILAEG